MDPSLLIFTPAILKGVATVLLAVAAIITAIREKRSHRPRDDEDE